MLVPVKDVGLCSTLRRRCQKHLLHQVLNLFNTRNRRFENGLGQCKHPNGEPPCLCLPKLACCASGLQNGIGDLGTGKGNDSAIPLYDPVKEEVAGCWLYLLKRKLHNPSQRFCVGKQVKSLTKNTLYC